jgi:hypothetical protein
LIEILPENDRTMKALIAGRWLGKTAVVVLEVDPVLVLRIVVLEIER